MHPCSLLVLLIYTFLPTRCALFGKRPVHPMSFANLTTTAVRSLMPPSQTQQLFSEDTFLVDQFPSVPITASTEGASAALQSTYPPESDQLFTTPAVQTPSALITPPPSNPTNPSSAPASCTPWTQCYILFKVSHLVIVHADQH